MEIIILRHLKHLKVVPSVKYFGQTLNFDYIIMELLGDNIDVYYFGITEQTLGEILENNKNTTRIDFLKNIRVYLDLSRL